MRIKNLKRILKYIIPLIIVVIVILFYFGIPIFANIKVEEFPYLKRSRIQDILITNTYFCLCPGNSGDLQFIVEVYKLSNPEFPKLEVIYEAENKGKTISDLPRAVIIHQKQDLIITSNVIDLSESGSSKSLTLFIFNKVNKGVILLIDTNKIREYDPFTRCLIRLKTNLFIFKEKLNYSPTKTQTLYWILAEETLPENYRKYLHLPAVEKLIIENQRKK